MSTIDEFEDGKEYVCAGKGEIFKKIEYGKIEVKKTKRILNCKIVPQQKNSTPSCVHPRIVTLIRNGVKPRKVSDFFLLNLNSIQFLFVYLFDVGFTFVIE